MATVYEQNGFRNREQYLSNLADEYGLDYDVVETMAHVLGPNEDFDGLVTALADFSGED